MSLFKRKPKPQVYVVMLYKPPRQDVPAEVRGTFASTALAVSYAESLSPATFPSVRFAILPYTQL